MRYATLDERKEFYTKEFDVKAAAEWFKTGLSGVKFAVIMGRHTKIFLEKYREDAETTVIIDEYNDMADVQAQVVDFLPEAVYYDRNIYGVGDQIVGQELAFDVDPENIPCPIHGTLADKMARKQGLGFCKIELDLAKKETVDLFEHLEKQFCDVKAVYSGRGFHLHVFDQQAYNLSSKERLEVCEAYKTGGLPHRRMGHNWRIPLNSLALQSQRVGVANRVATKKR